MLNRQLRSVLLPRTLSRSRNAGSKALAFARTKPQRRQLAGKPLLGPRRASVGHFFSTLTRRTSLMSQFHRVKAQFPHHLLLFQVGDFYELYEDDASEAASRTSLRLTKKAGVLMAGFPVRALDPWQRELVEAGLQLAICNQQPSRKDQSSPTLLGREVVRLVTPGTLTEPLDGTSNYLLSIAPGPHSTLGLAWSDISTSEFMISSVGVAELDEDLERLSPSEVLLPKNISEMIKGNLKMGQPSWPMVEGLLKSSLLKECHITSVPEEWYRHKEREGGGERNSYKDVHFHLKYLDSGLFSAIVRDTRFSQLERSAASALLWYIGHTHRSALPHLLPPSPFSHCHHLAIDASTRRALEIVSPQQGNSKKATLLGSLDKTLTASGGRLLRARLTFRQWVWPSWTRIWKDCLHQRYLDSGLFSAIVRDTRFSQLERSAASALLWYIGHTHRSALPHLLPPSPFSHCHHLAIDASTRRALEIVSPQQGNSKKATLLGSLDKTLTASGGRLLRARLTAPLTDISSINKRLDVVEVFRSFPLHREAVRVQLRSCADIQRALQKVATMSCSVADLRSMQTTLSTARSILHYLREAVEPQLPPSLSGALLEETRGLRELPHLVLELGRALGETNYNTCHYISPGYSEEVDRLREKMRENEAAVQRLASSLQEQVGVSKVSVMSFKMYGRVFEVSRAQATRLDSFPQLIRVDHTQSKARYTHVDLQTLNAELHGLETHYMQTQENLFQLLCDKVMAHAEDIMSVATSLARLDVATSLGLLAQERLYTRPIVVAEPVFQVEQGHHPVLASSSDPLSHHFVSNDCYLHPHRLWVLTGPNMGGKSTFLRQNSLLLIMAQVGSFVPAKRAVVGVADRLFARVGATDNVTKHMSTFHVEMAETANILATATRHSFVVLDEIGRGTSATEGLAIAESVIEHLSNAIGCRCLVATHYHQLGRDRQELLGPTVGCYQLEAELDSQGGLLRFTYKVKAGRAEHSFGIEVARLAGLPSAVIDKAKDLLINKLCQ